MATLEELEVRVEKLEWQTRAVASAMKPRNQMWLGQFILGRNLSEAEYNALEAVFAAHTASIGGGTPLDKTQLDADLVAELPGRAGLTGEEIVNAFYYGDKYLDLCKTYLQR